MKRYETTTIQRSELTGYVCDGCGTENDGYDMVQVIIAVHEGEEGGRRDEYDYCDDCLVERAPLFVAAGSKAPLVTGEYLNPDEDE